MKHWNITLACCAYAAVLHITSADATECEGLAGLKLAHTEITLAQTVAAGAFKPPEGAGGGGPGAPPGAYTRLPPFCRVAGTIRPTADSDIRFEVWMPASGWNGKFVGVGNGVWAGSITYFSMVEPLSMGYATAATDDGHQGNPLDGSFVAGHPEKLVDFGHRAPHEMTVAAKAIVAALYGKNANRSLFVSCSTGGRQGLMEAYRYPHDYDGISSMAPANPMVGLMVSSLWTGYATLKDAASRIPPQKFAIVHKAAVEACDADDGVKDGIISAPGRCRFDAAALQCKGDDAPDCLTGPQLAALRAIYQGPRNPRTGKQIYPGFEPGSETMFPIQTAGPEPFAVATTFMKSLVFKDSSWDFKSFDYDKDVAQAVQAGSAQLDVPPNGLEPFFTSGRKLLLSHGWADGLIPPMSTVNFYIDLTKDLGPKNSAESTRLFMIPGMGHCAGGEGPFVFDAISTLDKWVETGRAPERIVVSNPPSARARTRPLCPWPEEAVYSGEGSTDEEKNFKCAAPGNQTIPSSVSSDPAPDAAHPPRSAQVLVPSHGSGMNGLFYLAGGAGPHPTLVLLHGFPGNEQNLDLAQAVRRAGWNVLTLHYRGAWGSPGLFSIRHVMEDADAAVAFVRRPDVAAKFGIDTRRIVLGGHSMGGFATAAHARTDADLLGVVLIDAWNVGATADKLSKATAAELPALAAQEFDDLGNSLHGATATSVAKEIIAHRGDWNYLAWAAGLAHRPLLVIGAALADGEENRRLAEAVQSAGGQVTSVTLPSDHSFQDHRIALEAQITIWLQTLPVS